MSLPRGSSMREWASVRGKPSTAPANPVAGIRRLISPTKAPQRRALESVSSVASAPISTAPVSSSVRPILSASMQRSNSRVDRLLRLKRRPGPSLPRALSAVPTAGRGGNDKTIDSSFASTVLPEPESPRELAAQEDVDLIDLLDNAVNESKVMGTVTVATERKLKDAQRRYDRAYVAVTRRGLGSVFANDVDDTLELPADDAPLKDFMSTQGTVHSHTPGSLHNMRAATGGNASFASSGSAQTPYVPEDWDTEYETVFKPVTVSTPVPVRETASTKALEQLESKLHSQSLLAKRKRKEYVESIMNHLRADTSFARIKQFNAHVRQEKNKSKLRAHSALGGRDWESVNKLYCKEKDALREHRHDREVALEKRRATVYKLHHYILRNRMHVLEAKVEGDTNERVQRGKTWLGIIAQVVIHQRWLAANDERKEAMVAEAQQEPDEFNMTRQDYTFMFNKIVPYVARWKARRLAKSAQLIRFAWTKYRQHTGLVQIVHNFLASCRTVQRQWRAQMTLLADKKTAVGLQWDKYQLERMRYTKVVCDQALREKQRDDRAKQKALIAAAKKAKASPKKSSAVTSGQSSPETSPRRKRTKEKKEEAPPTQAFTPEYVARVGFHAAVPLARQVCAPFLVKLANPKMGNNPVAAATFGQLTLSIVNFDSVTHRVPARIKTLLLKFAMTRERNFHRVKVGDHIRAHKKALTLFKEALRVHAAQHSMNMKVRASVVASMGFEALPAHPDVTHPPPHRAKLLLPNEVRLLLLVGYSLVDQEKRFMFEHGAAGSFSSNPQQSEGGGVDGGLAEELGKTIYSIANIVRTTWWRRRGPRHEEMCGGRSPAGSRTAARSRNTGQVAPDAQHACS